MTTKQIIDRLKRLDAYPKPLEDFSVKTYGGAAVTIISAVIIICLFYSELQDYLNPGTTEEIFVDTSRGSKLKINFDFIFPNIACDFLSLDAMDTSGEQHLHIDHNVYKRRLDLSLQPIEDPVKEDIGVSQEAVVKNETEKCGSCYGAETPEKKCCNTCEEVKEAYRNKKWAPVNVDNVEQCKTEQYSLKLKNAFNEACQLYGSMEVNRVGGSFHIAPGQSFSINHVHVHDVQPFSSSLFNTSHIILHLSFGRDIEGVTNPIDGSHIIASEGGMMFQYYVKIVPTTYVKGGQILQTNQFSITKHDKTLMTSLGDSGMPGVFFSYELSPMMVKISQKERSFGHFATSVCAIIGGVFTVAGIIDSLLYHSLKAIQRKIELGKLS